MGSIATQFLEDTDNVNKKNDEFWLMMFYNKTAKILQLLSSAFNEEEINSILSSLEFILSNSIRFDVEDSVLLKELIDLGLPKGFSFF